MSLTGGSKFILTGGANYQIARSLRFRSGASAYLSRTPGGAGTSNKIFTISCWVKKCEFLSQQIIFATRTDDTNRDDIIFAQGSTDDTIYIYSGRSGTNLRTTSTYRDPSAWFHFNLGVDTTQATAANRVTIEINGVAVTSFSTTTYPTLNSDWEVSKAVAHAIGRFEYSAPSAYFGGYLAEYRLIDGQKLTASNFCTTDATTGAWTPKAYSGTYGTNGFYLKGDDPLGAAPIAPAIGGNDTYTKGLWHGNSLGDSAWNRGSDHALTATGGTISSTQTKLGLANSLKTVAASSQYFRTDAHADFQINATSGNANDFTFDFWFYNTGNANPYPIFSLLDIGYPGLLSVGYNQFYSSSNSSTWDIASSKSLGGVQTANTWNHYAFVRSGSTWYIFVNGTQVDTWTSSLAPYYSSNYLQIGRAQGGTYYSDGYYQEIRWSKGIARWTGTFTPPAKPYSGGFGSDYSGNANDFYPSGMSNTAGVTNDSLVDTPTNYGSDTGAGGEVRGNYATLSPLANGATLSDGNLKFTWASASWASARATQPLFDGAYVECEGVSGLNSNFGISRGDDNAVLSTTCGFTVTSVSYLNDGKVYKNTADLGIASTSTWSTTDKVCLYFKNGAVWFGKLSGSTITWQLNGAASQAAIVAEMIAGTTTHAAASGLTGDYFVTPSGSGSGSTASYYINFGQRAWVGVTNFPTGAKALCTQNLPDPAIPKPSSYFDVATITGTGAAINIPQAVQSPDLYFLKDRSGVSNWQIGDTSRTNGNNLHSNSTAAGVSNPSAYFSGTTIGMQPYDADGGQNAHAYVAAQWKKGATPGIDIVTWTGNGTSGNPGRSVSHGLGVKPAMIIGKRTDSTSDWGVWHKSFSNDVYYLKLNSTAAQFTGGTTSSPFGGGGPYFSSTVFYVSDNADTLNVNSGTYVGYVFAEIAGFSKFGSYTGNGSADGPFVWCGFRPRWLVTKRADSTSDWHTKDTARKSYNLQDDNLYLDVADAEDTVAPVDILSNGFKLRATGGNNVPGGTYIFAAFAEAPFKTARAR